jgi:hypothetical protein
LIDEENIYANIQEFAAPIQVEWDYKNASLWKPFLEPLKLRKMFPEGVKTIQGPLFYEETPSEYAVHLSR